MTKEEILSLVEEKEEELIDALMRAFCESIDHTHLKFNVELYDDGDIRVWEDLAGGNSITNSSFNGTSVCVASFCNQYLEAEVEADEDEKEWFEWYKNEYKAEEATNRLDYFVKTLEDQ